MLHYLRDFHARRLLMSLPKEVVTHNLLASTIFKTQVKKKNPKGVVTGMFCVRWKRFLLKYLISGDLQKTHRLRGDRTGSAKNLNSGLCIQKHVNSEVFGHLELCNLPFLICKCKRTNSSGSHCVPEAITDFTYISEETAAYTKTMLPSSHIALLRLPTIIHTSVFRIPL